MNQNHRPSYVREQELVSSRGNNFESNDNFFIIGFSSNFNLADKEI